MNTKQTIATPVAVKVNKVKVEQVKVNDVKGEQGGGEGEHFYVRFLRLPCIEIESKDICEPNRKS